MARTALIAGSTGIVGNNLARHLADEGWTVHGLARHPGAMPGVAPVSADLTDPGSLKAALAEAETESPLHRHLDASADRGGELRRQRRHRAQPARRP